MTIREVLPHMTDALQRVGFEQPQYEARELLKALTGLSTADLLTHDETALTEQQELILHQWMQKRLRGAPLAYLTKEKGFFKHIFKIEPGVLVPRPETELVVEIAIRRASAMAIGIRQMADLGAGSGCIGLSLIYEWTQAQLWCVESSPRAGSLIVNNAEMLQLYDRVHVDCIGVESWDPETTFDLIVSNPPYIPVGDPRVEKAVHDHEPHAALYSGTDGLTAIRNWIPKAFALLNPGGLCVFEFGAGQSEAVRAIMDQSGFYEVQIHRDLAGIERVISGSKHG